jgi:hypothetical protein
MSGKSTTVALSTHEQTADKITQLVHSILGRAGCLSCGRIALLHVEFQSDPPPEIAKLGATSFAEQR